MSFTVGEPQQTGLGVALSGLASGIGQGLNQTLTKRLETHFQEKKLNNLENQFVQRGFPAPLARLAAIATTGGQTEVLKKVLESQERFPQMGMSVQPLDDNLDDASFVEDEDLKVPEFDKATFGMTAKEKQAYRKEYDKRSYERNKKYLDRITDISNEIPKEKAALAQMRGALDTGDFNSVRNIASELTGWEFLKNAPAQVVNAANKQYLMSSLAGMTGRPNQFIEQQITRAAINPQYRDAANQLIFEGMEGLASLKEEEVKIAQDIENKFVNAGREIPRNFQNIVKDRLKNKAEEFEKRYEKSVRDRLKGLPQEKIQDTIIMIDREGRAKQVPSKDKQKALNDGYRLP